MISHYLRGLIHDMQFQAKLGTHRRIKSEGEVEDDLAAACDGHVMDHGWLRQVHLCVCVCVYALLSVHVLECCCM